MLNPRFDGLRRRTHAPETDIPGLLSDLDQGNHEVQTRAATLLSEMSDDVATNGLISWLSRNPPAKAGFCGTCGYAAPDEILRRADGTPIKKRHWVLTTYLTIMLLANAMVALFMFDMLPANPFAGMIIDQRLPRPPDAIIPISLVGGILGIVWAVALFKWKRWGFWGFFATG